LKPKDRIELSIRGEPSSTPAVLPLIGAHSAVIFNANVHKAFTDGKLMADLQTKVAELYKPDGIFHYMDLTVEAEALGAKIQFRGHFPAVVEHHIPEEPEFDESKGRIRHFIRAVRLLNERVGNELFIGAYVTGPLTLAFELLGSRDVVRWLAGKGGVVGDLLPRLTKFISEYAKALIDNGAEGVMVLEPCCALASPKMFRSVISFINETCTTIRARGAIPFLHTCGDVTHLLPLLHEVEALVYQIDSMVDLRRAREVIPDKCLMGNIDTSLLLRGGIREIVEAVRKCISYMDARQYILSAGCEIPPRTPPEHLKAMISEARRKSKNGRG